MCSFFVLHRWSVAKHVHVLTISTMQALPYPVSQTLYPTLMSRHSCFNAGYLGPYTLAIGHCYSKSFVTQFGIQYMYTYTYLVGIDNYITKHNRSNASIETCTHTNNPTMSLFAVHVIAGLGLLMNAANADTISLGTHNALNPQC